LTRLNHGAPTLARAPDIASTRIGYSVPNSTAKVSPRKSTLLNRNADSRLTTAPGGRRSRRSGRRQIRRPSATPRVSRIADANHAPIPDVVKACTLFTTPERVRKVPTNVSTKVAITSAWVHVRSVPRRSATMLEWMKAVAVSHGSSAAFSTGSQAQ